MELAQELAKEFAKVINANKQTTKKETIVYGTTVEQGGKMFVKIDGSEQLTPITTTTAVKDGQRVTVMIKNHTATVTGNLSAPSASSADIDSLNTKISEFEIVMAHKITTDDLTALNANINNIKAVVADIEELEAVNAQIESLEAMFAELEYVDATNIDAVNAEIEKLEVMFADISDLSAEELEAVNAEIKNLKAYTADFTYVSAEKLEAVQAQIDNLVVGDLEAKYANIDFSNIGEAAMEYFYAESGLIKDVTVGDATITGELVGVTIRGDRLIGGTVIADKLVIQGEDGLYYKLNFDGGDFLEGEEVPTDSLHGSVITANSITAEKINVEDLVAFDATIGGFNITENSLYSGVKESVDNTTRGVYLDSEGQMAIGDATNFIKYYKDEESGEYKLVMLVKNFTVDDDGSVSVTGNITSKGQITLVQDDIDITTELKTELSAISYPSLSWSDTDGVLISGKTLKDVPIFVIKNANGIQFQGYMIGEQAKINSLYAGTLGAADLVAEEAYLGSTKVESLSSIGKITASGDIKTSGQFQSTTANGIRIVAGNYGFFIRNDGSYTYFMHTKSGDQYGSYSTTRPLYINNATGAVNMGNGLTVGSGLTVSSGGMSVTGELISAHQTNKGGLWAQAGIAVGSSGSTTTITHIQCGSTVIKGANSSARIFLTDATIKSWYPQYLVGKTSVLVSNGDSASCSAHFEGATYASNSQGTGWFVVADSSIASTTNIRINWAVICFG